jgi:hypothetical protein
MFRIVCVGLIILAGCSGPVFPDESWISTGEVQVRITRQYRMGDDYYTFAAKPLGNPSWQNIATIRQDATGEMPSENVRSISGRVTYFFLVDQFLVTTDGGLKWSAFDASRHFRCGFSGCAGIKQVTIDDSGAGILHGFRREEPDWLDFELRTTDFGRTWTTNP